jgi:hypothetical protein
VCITWHGRSNGFQALTLNFATAGDRFFAIFDSVCMERVFSIFDIGGNVGCLSHILMNCEKFTTTVSLENDFVFAFNIWASLNKGLGLYCHVSAHAASPLYAAFMCLKISEGEILSDNESPLL